MHIQCYPTAVATRALNIKQNLKPVFSKAADNEFLGYAVNDFGLRGGMFREAASIGGAAHLIHFERTDNLPAIQLIEDYYGSVGRYIGGSVWATEHSVATVWGPGEGEYEYIKAQLTRSDPNSIVSIVIDSYDADNFIKNVITREDVKSLIVNRPGRVVFRPDSGSPLNNVCKYSEMLGNSFGYSLNRKGYKVINNNVGLIQGDGMTENSIPETYREYIKTGWSPENFITGSGGGLLVEGLTRDTDRWAIKVSHVEIDGQSVNVSKTPQSDLTKLSKPGMLKLAEVNKRFSTISSAQTTKVMFNSYIDSLETVFENGEIMREQTFEDVRKTALYYLK